MQKPGVDANHERGASHHPRHLIERRAIRHPRARCRPGDPAGALALGLGAERHDQIDTGAERGRQHPPVVLRPFLVGAGGGVQQHGVRFGGRPGQSRAVEAEVRRTVRGITQRQAGQRAVARNRVLVPLHLVDHIIERAGEHLLDAVGIVAVAAAARGARNQRRFEEQPLRIDDLVIGAGPKRAQEIPDLPPCLGLPRRLAPVASPDRDDLANRRMQPHQRRKRLLHHPGKSGVRPPRAGLGQRRHVMDHVAERGRLDKKHIGHGGFVQIGRAPYTRH